MTIKGARERLGELVTGGGWRGVVSRNCVTLSSVYTSVLVAATLAASRAVYTGAALANKSIQFVRRLQSDVDPVYGQHSYARPLAALKVYSNELFLFHLTNDLCTSFIKLIIILFLSKAVFIKKNFVISIFCAKNRTTIKVLF